MPSILCGLEGLEGQAEHHIAHISCHGDHSAVPFLCGPSIMFLRMTLPSLKTGASAGRSTWRGGGGQSRAGQGRQSLRTLCECEHMKCMNKVGEYVHVCMWYVCVCLCTCA